jgi:hypothetical protein
MHRVLRWVKLWHDLILGCDMIYGKRCFKYTQLLLRRFVEYETSMSLVYEMCSQLLV